jgi:hypothetical protein
MMVLWGALINWLVTTIFVESKLFEPLRTWIIHEAYAVRHADAWHKIGNKHWYTFPEETTQEEADAATPVLHGPWAKVAQLVTCQLCTRVWVGFAEAAYFGGPDHGWARLVANGLLYAALGHLIFELRSRVALVLPGGTDG